MVNWKHTLDLSDIWAWFEQQGADAKYDEQKVRELGNKVAKRIRGRSWFEQYEYELDDFAGTFEAVDTIDEFDSVLADLYDWGDSGHTCWIKT